MLTRPREITEPRRERDNNEFSGSTFDVSVVDSVIEICLDPRRGGGDNDVTSGYCSIGDERFRGFGIGSDGVTGVRSCKKLGSSCIWVIFSPIGVAGGGGRLAIVGVTGNGGVGGGGRLVVGAGADGDGALRIRNRCLIEV